jgi:hypothetical protein
MSVQTRQAVSDLMLQRVCGEFLEMPGLRLTSRQAQRLWGLDEQTCTTLLEYLVEARFLFRLGSGAYARLTDGEVPCPPRMAKADLKKALPPRARAV